MPETNPIENQPLNIKESQADKKQMTLRKTLAFSIEFGFMIALPLVFFGLLGKRLAARHHNQGFLYGALILALLTSIAWLWKRIYDIYRDYLN